MKKVLWIGLVILAVTFGSFGYAQESQAVNQEKLIVTQFSFASDSEHQRPTFSGGKNIFSGKAEVELVVDLNQDAYGGTVKFFSLFEMRAETYNYKLFFIGSQWLHVWKVYTEFRFTHINPAVNAPILTVYCKEALLTSWSPSQYMIGETMTLQNCESSDQSLTMISEKLLQGIGVPNQGLQRSEDFAFTFTKVQPSQISTAPLVRVDQAGNFLDEWRSEGSFSASALGSTEFSIPEQK